MNDISCCGGLAAHTDDSAPLVSMRGVDKVFSGMYANRGVDFDLARGEVHALLGENGAGKTTLMNVLAGGLWGAIPGFLKGKWNVNEIIATLMLNYIALYLMDLLLYGAWKDPASMGFPMTAPFPPEARLWAFGNTRLHGGLVMALVISVVTWFVIRKTRWGFEIRVIGENRLAARYSGMSVMKNIVLVMFVSGAIAGLCGMSEVAGLQGRLSRGFSVGYGFTGVIVAWLAGLNALALPFVAFLMGILLVGANQVVSGLALSMFGGGMSALLGREHTGETIKGLMPFKFPFLGDIPIVGPILFQHDAMVYASYLLVAFLCFYIFRTKPGMNLWAVGKTPERPTPWGSLWLVCAIFTQCLAAVSPVSREVIYPSFTLRCGSRA